jgi:hypothetical protein
MQLTVRGHSEGLGLDQSRGVDSVSQDVQSRGLHLLGYVPS